MITDDKITEIFCATNDFCEKNEEEIGNKPLLSSMVNVTNYYCSNLILNKCVLLLNYSTVIRFGLNKMK